MSHLDRIRGPKDLGDLSPRELAELAAEIRASLITNVSATGGHLGPNLGVVELTIALHRVFDSPTDPIIFDVGHQAYVHKMLTGRTGQLPTLRQRGGLSGYPSRAESEHDWVENSHASTALSWAEGLAKGFRLQGVDRTVVAVVGDGALTGGMTWEAMNNISADDDLPLIIVANDNGRSYTPTVGGVARALSPVRTDRRYEDVLDLLRRSVSSTPVIGKAAYEWLHGVKAGLKDVLNPQGLFADLGMKYVGPIDGHDIEAVEYALTQAKGYGGPVIVHVRTQKGHGFTAAVNHEEDQFHAVGQIDPVTGKSKATSGGTSWTSVFADALLHEGKQHPGLVAVTAAMMYPTGLHKFHQTFPERTFDVGIAEQHAVTSAAGLAASGMHPVVAIYSTFVNRAFDQVLMDVALHKQGVTFVLDRAGITGPDGPSHHGMWDLSLLGLVPGLQLWAPRDATRLTEALAAAVQVSDAPTVLRFPKGTVGEELPAVATRKGMDVLAAAAEPRVLVVGYGPMAAVALQVGEQLDAQGISTTVIDPVRALPVNPELVEVAAEHELVISIEDGGEVGGLGARLAQEMRAAGVSVPLREFGVPQAFHDHASRDEVLAECGLSAQQIARYAVETVSRSDHAGVAEVTLP
ncbi:1-deoxy-D-xylulose-5-phosphate synthase [Naumannella halotolerans]|uniref:1-deoxy-D-xylulose-5-phosphate synthase n=1 Tax=Naumannella halotolerans TaxID=993414 RepID=A0A4R7J754_9ACTN|nr:1-deoxy-D-xylulose-5-phosphate synthase [Naumannella halotolerans]TDT33251.1 1-deoxy-D-xylulose-5-phosphate synthase [Naumannella halotolerans]